MNENPGQIHIRGELGRYLDAPSARMRCWPRPARFVERPCGWVEFVADVCPIRDRDFGLASAGDNLGTPADVSGTPGIASLRDGRRDGLRSFRPDLDRGGWRQGIARAAESDREWEIPFGVFHNPVVVSRQELVKCQSL
jgi:hypothetical protein